MTPEPAAAAEIKPSAKPAHCANVAPNKVRGIIGLVGSKSGRRRIPIKLIAPLCCRSHKSNERSFRRWRLKNDGTNYRETLACFARDDTAGAGLGQPEQKVMDGFA